MHGFARRGEPPFRKGEPTARKSEPPFHGRNGTQAAFPVAEAARKSLIAHKLELFRIENWFREVGAALRP